MPISKYLKEVSENYARGNASEHTYRPALKQFIESLYKDIVATNEPKRIECGAPDYVITKKNDDTPIGYIEAKDVGTNLNDRKYNEQFGRYKESLNNLIITDYLEFEIYENGVFKTSVKIGEIRAGRIIPLPENFDKFKEVLLSFISYKGMAIKSANKLAELMAGKAKLLKKTLVEALLSNEKNADQDKLDNLFNFFKEVLIADIDENGFANIYAQTIIYGMFVARINDTSTESFTKEEANTYLPKSNPFLRNLFNDIAGYNVDKRIEWIVNDLINMFSHVDVREIVKGFERKSEDPTIHFYETFLGKYDSKEKKALGVFYTPKSVVSFIVKSVDQILKTEFGIADGISGTNTSFAPPPILHLTQKKLIGFKYLTQQLALAHS